MMLSPFKRSQPLNELSFAHASERCGQSDATQLNESLAWPSIGASVSYVSTGSSAESARSVKSLDAVHERVDMAMITASRRASLPGTSSRALPLSSASSVVTMGPVGAPSSPSTPPVHRRSSIGGSAPNTLIPTEASGSSILQQHGHWAPSPSPLAPGSELRPMRAMTTAGRRGSVPLCLPVSDLSTGPQAPRQRTMSSAGLIPPPSPGTPLHGASRRASFEWDAGFEFSRTEGTGVSACEEAGYLFGAQETGVRGKAGTPGFWAPEMLFYERDGKGRRYGPAVDYWSLGCLVYALLAARGPFTVIGGDTSDDNAATLNNDPDLNLPVFSPAAASLLRVRVLAGAR